MGTTQWSMKSRIGRLFLVATEKGLQGVFWEKQTVPMAKTLNGESREVKILARSVAQLSEYFSGQRKEFDLPLDLRGTDFQKQVWNQLRKIPYGKTLAYKDVAKNLKKTKATRAVGNANGKNPLCIIIPCHRVIAADGSIGGYSAGIKRKIKLLEWEQRV